MRFNATHNALKCVATVECVYPNCSTLHRNTFAYKSSGQADKMNMVARWLAALGYDCIAWKLLSQAAQFTQVDYDGSHGVAALERQGAHGGQALSSVCAWANTPACPPSMTLTTNSFKGLCR